MTHRVLLQDVIAQYYNYMRHAMHMYSGGKPLWQLEFNRDAFEEKWFKAQGIGMLKSTKDGKTVGVLAFENKESYIHWFLRWS